MFSPMLTETATISRKASTGITGGSSMQQLYTGIRCTRLPMNRTTAVELGFSLGKATNIYFDVGQDVRADDQVVIGGHTYSVGAVQAYNMPLVGHTLAFCEEEIS